MQQHFVYLASHSPRRRELLSQIHVAYETLTIEIDETRLADESPVAYVQRVALLKARAGVEQLPAGQHSPVLGADTTVVLDGECLGKPVDDADAARMLRRISGRQHEVLTAVTLISNKGEQSALSRSRVSFAELTEQQIQRYCASGEPLGKAGAYAIQGRAAAFICDLQGSYSGVMGLPLYETAQLLAGCQ